MLQWSKVNTLIIQKGSHPVYNLIQILKTFRDINPDATVAALLLFCLIKRDGNTHVSDLIQNSGLNKTTVSRNIDILTARGRGAKQGLGLIQDMEDPVDRRYKVVTFTEKGKTIHDSLLQNLGKSRVSH
jgi:DNA-binding MarR family transcriptional regulator